MRKHRFLILILGSCAAALIILSVLYFKERIGYHDTPSYLIGIISKDGFDVHHARFVSMASEWLPLLLLKAGASFKAMAVSYSLANVLIPVTLSAICLFLFKDVYKALAILLFWVIMNSMLFYYVCSEVQAGLALLIFYDALIDFVRPRRNNLLILAVMSIILLPTVLYSHPMNILVIAAWMIYRFANRKYLLRSEVMLIAIITIIAYIIKKQFFVSAYEVGKSPAIGALLHKLSPDIYIGLLARTFYDYLLKDAFLVPVLFIATIILLVRQHKKPAALAVFLIVAGFYTLILLTFQAGDMHYDHYAEHLMQPIALFIILPFADNLRGAIKSKVALNAGLGLIFAISLSKIATGHQIVTARHDWYRREFALMDRCHSRKALISRDELLWGTDKGGYWNSADETLFLSSLDGPDSSKTLFACWPWFLEQSRKAGDENTLLQDGSTAPISSYRRPYFDLGHQEYMLLRHDSCIHR